MEVHRRVERLKMLGSAKAAAEFCGVSQSVLSDPRNSHRNTAPAILRAVGLVAFKQRNFYADADFAEIRHDDVISENVHESDDSGLRHRDVVRQFESVPEQEAFIDSWIEGIIED